MPYYGHDGAPGETTALLPNGHSGTNARPDGFDWKHFFLHRRSTPGTESSNWAIRYSASTWHVTKVTLLSNYVNFLLVVVPFGILAGELKWDPTSVFVLNFFAIIPLAAVLSFATEEISMKLGETMGGLLNATFGNAVELIVSIAALRKDQIEVVQASMLGSILSNLLLVLGMCFFFGGLRNLRNTDGTGMEQQFPSGTAQTTCSLLALSSASLVIPATLYNVLDNQKERIKSNPGDPVLLLSRGTAIILLILYVLYLFFQLRTHHNLFDSQAAANRVLDDPTALDSEANGDIEADADADDLETEEPCMGAFPAALVLIVTTIIIAICADYLVGTIDNVVDTAGISKTFVGLILIPIVGNAAEHVTAVVVAVKNKMDLAMGVAIGSSIQIALFLTPFLVIVGWAMGKPMSLHFETFSTVAFAFSVLVVTYTVQDGRSNYLEGAMLLGLYCIIALAFYVSPSLEDPSVLIG
ncbi:related to calcium/proton exchanger [Cephalotrichum gorgonifer]|uniref:Vacuolar calcium ion transporter n=1 Tax=Cephalotrichum gorgonifer TaxID=2041049 RepID=A0AAE8N3N5_9PEZI|nr:related to calcium/proton exchanger [Cephalotrichum gorgonifer]